MINGASELLEQVFGERGRHARSAVSAHTLPFNIAVEIEMIAQVNDGKCSDCCVHGSLVTAICKAGERQRFERSRRGLGR